MKILFLYKECPTPAGLNGCRRRGYQFLKTFADAGHEITLLYTDINSAPGYGLEEARRLCSEVVAVPKTWGWKKRHLQDRFFPGYPLLRPGYHTPAFEKAMVRTVDTHSFDMVFLGQGQLEIYSDHLKGLPVLSDPTDAWNHLIKSFLGRETSFWKRWYLKRQLRDVEEHIRMYYPRMACTAWATERDARAIRDLDPSIRTAVVPNWVDTGYFAPGGDESDRPALVFTGVMNARPNVDCMLWFLRSVYPALSRDIRGLRLFIVGRNPSEELLSEASWHAGVTVTGEVNDVRPYLRSAWVSICPMREGAGIKNKILEAMAMGKPVVTTREGMVGIVDPANEDSVAVADDPVSLRERILELLQDGSVRHRMGQRARQFIMERFSPAVVGEQIMRLAEDVHTAGAVRVTESGVSSAVAPGLSAS